MTAQRTITVAYGARTFSGQLATIKSTTFGYEDHGILTAMVHCEWPGGGVGVGGYALDRPVTVTGDRLATAYGLDFLTMMMRTVGAESWEKLPGNHVLVLFDAKPGESTWGSRAVGVAHATDESRVFICQEHAECWRDDDVEVTS